MTTDLSLGQQTLQPFGSPGSTKFDRAPLELLASRIGITRPLCVLALLGISCACGDDGAIDTLAQAHVIEDASLQTNKARPDSRETADATAPMDGESMLYEECNGPPYGQGSCDDNQICAAMARVPYKYCMPAPPCEDGMVEVTKVACAYPCEVARDCKQHGLARCAQNEFADLAGEAKGWCTP